MSRFVRGDVGLSHFHFHEILHVHPDLSGPLAPLGSHLRGCHSYATLISNIFKGLS